VVLTKSLIRLKPSGSKKLFSIFKNFSSRSIFSKKWLGIALLLLKDDVYSDVRFSSFINKSFRTIGRISVVDSFPFSVTHKPAMVSSTVLSSNSCMVLSCMVFMHEIIAYKFTKNLLKIEFQSKLYVLFGNSINSELIKSKMKKLTILVSFCISWFTSSRLLRHRCSFGCFVAELLFYFG